MVVVLYLEGDFLSTQGLRYGRAAAVGWEGFT